MNKCETCKCNKVCDHYHFGFENCDNYISVDCVEVVRCRDCKYRILWDNGMGGQKNFCELFYRGVVDDEYCSYGKRKGGAK